MTASVVLTVSERSVGEERRGLHDAVECVCV